MSVLRVLGAVACLMASGVAWGSSSVYTARVDDAKAVYVVKDGRTIHGDGVGDDSAGLQAAIDLVEETTGQGIVFVPEGRYRISKTLYVWPGVRVIGYGAHRPVLMLGDHAEGFGVGTGYMVFFAGARHPRGGRGAGGAFPGTVPAATVSDANPGTFYSAMSNVDFAMGEGNAGAVGIRSHYAQHCFLTHMDFHIGSGRAGIEDAGNEAEDLHFYGGQYGIVTGKPSPGWQFTLLDSSFEGQREAAIREHEAGLTLVRDRFARVPSAVVIEAGYADELWVQETRFEEISGPAIVVSNEKNERTEISVQDVVCRGVPVFARFRKSGDEERGAGGMYRVREFSHGLKVRMGGAAEIGTTFQSEALTRMPEMLPARIKALPDSAGWVNLKSLGVKGDGVTDDTAAIESAVKSNKVLYVPSGRYKVSRTIALRPETVLLGLHPSTTQFYLAEKTEGFDGAGGPVALLSTPAGGTNVVSGIGLYTGGVNRRAVGAMWRAGKDSLMDDVRFLGGHGTNAADGSRMNPYNSTHTADPDAEKRWDGQYPSLWVTDGGGGVFTDIWTPDTFAQAGMYVSHTRTEGHVYELSSEHHVRTEVKLDGVANWELIALQTEEEHGEGPSCLPLEIDGSEHVLVANMHSYRVVGMQGTYPYAVRVAGSNDVRFRNLHVDSDSKVSFDDAVWDADAGVGTRFRELQELNVGGGGAVAAAGGAKRVATGFYNISGAVTDGAGRIYFVDARWQKIYRWSAERGVEVVRDAPMDAVNLAMDKAGNLMVVSYEGKGTVYSLKPDAPAEEMSVLKPQPATAVGSRTEYLPVDYWTLKGDRTAPEPLKREFQYVSEDGSTVLPAGRDFVNGELYYGTKMSDVLRSFALAKVTPGQPFYVTAEEEHKTYVGSVDEDGTLGGLKLFAERGGESVTTGPDGRVYIAAGQVYVYSREGKLLETLEVPERPTDLTFGGKDGRTLFVLARTSLYTFER